MDGGIGALQGDAHFDEEAGGVVHDIVQHDVVHGGNPAIVFGGIDAGDEEDKDVLRHCEGSGGGAFAVILDGLKAVIYEEIYEFGRELRGFEGGFGFWGHNVEFLPFGYNKDGQGNCGVRPAWGGWLLTHPAYWTHKTQ